MLFNKPRSQVDTQVSFQLPCNYVNTPSDVELKAQSLNTACAIQEDEEKTRRARGPL